MMIMCFKIRLAEELGSEGVFHALPLVCNVFPMLFCLADSLVLQDFPGCWTDISIVLCLLCTLGYSIDWFKNRDCVCVCVCVCVCTHPQFLVLCLKHQFSSVTQSCLTLCDPMNRSTPGLPVHHQLPEFTQTHVHRVGDAIQPSHPLSSPSPPAPKPSQHQSLFQ